MSEFWTRRTVNAGKLHRCAECDAAITVGQAHVYRAGKVEGHMLDFRLCLPCDAILVEGCQAFWEEGAPVGSMREVLRDEHGVADPDAWAEARRPERQAREAAQRERWRRLTIECALEALGKNLDPSTDAGAALLAAAERYVAAVATAELGAQALADAETSHA